MANRQVLHRRLVVGGGGDGGVGWGGGGVCVGRGGGWVVVVGGGEREREEGVYVGTSPCFSIFLGTHPKVDFNFWMFSFFSEILFVLFWRDAYFSP